MKTKQILAARLDSWSAALPGGGPVYPMVRIDWQSDAEYTLYDEMLEGRKVFIFHDGTRLGRRTAWRMAEELARHGETVRPQGGGIVAIFNYCDDVTVWESIPSLHVVSGQPLHMEIGQ